MDVLDGDENWEGKASTQRWTDRVPVTVAWWKPRWWSFAEEEEENDCYPVMAMKKEYSLYSILLTKGEHEFVEALIFWFVWAYI